ncbi:MAG: PilW family protein [Methylococcales bacterium]
MLTHKSLTNNSSTCKRALLKGISLIELMISITIGLIAVSGITSIYISSNQAYKLQGDISVMQENSRALIHLVSNDLRMADHWGGIGGGKVNVGKAADIVLTGIGSCDSDWIVDPNNPVEGISGYEGGASPPLPAGCIASGNYVANTDIIVIRYASGNGMIKNAELNDTSPNNAAHLFVKSTIGENAEINIGLVLYDDDTDDIDELNFPYQISVYFIRPCYDKAGSVCASTDDNGSPIPTLARLTLDGSTLIQEALIDGVEQLQFEYGIMGTTGSSDGSVIEFKKSNAMSAVDRENIGAIRMGTIIRSNSLDTTYTDSKTYRFPDPASNATAGDDDYIPSDTAKKYRRKQFIKTIQIRNRIKS